MNMKLLRRLSMSLFFASVALVVVSCDKDSTKAANTHSTSTKKTTIDQQIHTYLITHPEVLIEMTAKLEDKTRQAQQQQAIPIIKAHANALFADKLSPVAGNTNGAVTIIEFFDYQCVACAKTYPMMKKIIAANPTVKLVFKEFPIFGQTSEYAAAAALAAAKQGKYAAMQHALFNSGSLEGNLRTSDVDAIARKIGLDLVRLKQDMQADTVQKELSATRLLAYKLSLDGTPNFIIAPTDIHNSPDDKISFIPGGPAVDVMQQAIDQAT